MIERIHWLGSASFRINGPPHNEGPVVYIDPFRLPADSPAADLVLVSNDHYDNCSPEDVARVTGPRTVILANQRAAGRLPGNVQVLRPWQGAYRSSSVSVTAVPAYSVNHASYARNFGGLGFIISMMRHDIYYAGDTELIPEMATIGCDIALLPIGGEYMMAVEDAVQAVKLLKPVYAIPMSYSVRSDITNRAGRRFVELVNGGCTGVQLPVENSNY